MISLPDCSRIAACLLVLVGMTAVHAADDVALVPKQLTPHVWFFQGESGMASAANKGFMSNAGFVVTSDGVVVFDALGTPALGRAMLAAIARVTPQPVTRVVVSHYHADHIYGLQALKATGADVWAHRNSRQYLASAVSADRLAQRRVELFPWVDADTRIVPPDVVIDGDTDFRLGGMTFRIIHTGGTHAPDDIMLHVVDERVLFCGDLIFSGRIPFVGDGDSRNWLASIEKLIAIAPAVVVPGHGAASTDVARDLVLTRDYLRYLRETMGHAVDELASFDDAYARVDWSRYAELPAFEQANRINAYGTYLRLEQEALDKAKP